MVGVLSVGCFGVVEFEGCVCANVGVISALINIKVIKLNSETAFKLF